MSSSKENVESKEKHERRESRKRRREEQDSSEEKDTITAEVIDDEERIDVSSQPSKKRRKSDKHPIDRQSPNPSESQPQTAVQSTLIINNSTEDNHSPFVTITAALQLPLSPQAYGYPIAGLCTEHISPHLLTYYPPFDGILISYSNPRISESINIQTHPPSYLEPPPPRDKTESSKSQAERQQEETTIPLVLATSMDEYAAPMIWLIADFALLRPERGSTLKGSVRVQNQSWLGLMCWNYFNAGIPKVRLPKGWKWIDDHDNQDIDEDDEEEAGEKKNDDSQLGYWINGDGKKVEGVVEFRLRDFESAHGTDRDRGFISLEGTLLSEEEDKKVDIMVKDKERGRRKHRL